MGDAGARHATVSMPACRSRSRDFSLRVFSRSHPYKTFVQKNQQETLSTEQPIPVSANAPHENHNRSEYDYDWIQNFHYCSDDVDWRDQLCKRPVPDLRNSKSRFVSGTISRQGYIERLRVDASRQSGVSNSPAARLPGTGPTGLMELMEQCLALLSTTGFSIDRGDLTVFLCAALALVGPAGLEAATRPVERLALLSQSRVDRL